MLRSSLFARHAMYGMAALVATANAALAKDPWDSVIGGRTDNPDGSSAITVGRKLPTEWETKVGADFNLAPPPSTDIRPDQPPLPDPNDRSTGAAWANVTLSSPAATLGWDKATVEGRIDPLHEQSKLGTTFSRSVPVGPNLSVTLEDGYAVTRASGADASPNGAAQGWETGKAVRLKVAPAETTFSLSIRMSDADGRWLNAVGAQQKLFGPVTVTGTVSETPNGELNRSITAGFKRSW